MANKPKLDLNDLVARHRAKREAAKGARPKKPAPKPKAPPPKVKGFKDLPATRPGAKFVGEMDLERGFKPVEPPPHVVGKFKVTQTSDHRVEIQYDGDVYPLIDAAMKGVVVLTLKARIR